MLARAARSQGEGEPLVVFNLLPFERTGVIELDAATGVLVDADGARVPQQLSAEGRHLAWVRVPGLGHAVFHERRVAGGDAPDASHAAQREDWTFTSSRLALRLDPETGDLASLRVLPEGIELVDPKSNAIAWQPAPSAGSTPAARALRKPESIEVVEDGPVRLIVRIVRRLDGAQLVEDLVLERDRADLVVRCRAEGWKEPGTLLVGVSLPAKPTTLSVDRSGAAVALDPAQREASAWIDMRRFVAASNGEHGLALLGADLQRCGAAGSRLTLEIAQGGAGEASTCTFALRPYLEQGSAGNLAAYADDLAWPLESVKTSVHKGVRPARHSYFELGREYADGAVVHGARTGLELLAVEPRAYGYELLLRERFAQPAVLQLELDRNLFAAEGVDPRTAAATSIPTDHRRIKQPVSASGAAVLRLRLRP